MPGKKKEKNRKVRKCQTDRHLHFKWYSLHLVEHSKLLKMRNFYGIFSFLNETQKNKKKIINLIDVPNTFDNLHSLPTLRFNISLVQPNL